MRETVRRAGHFCKQAGKTGAKKGKRGIIYVVTSDKTIQAVMTGAVVGAISKMSEGNAAIVQAIVYSILGIPIPSGYFTALILIGIFAAAFWADRHTEQWRDIVREKTDEQDVVDEAEAESDEGE